VTAKGTAGPLRRIVVSGLALLGLLLLAAPGATADIALTLSVDRESRITALDPGGAGLAEGTFSVDDGGDIRAQGAVHDEFVSVDDELGPKIVRAVETYTADDGTSFELRSVGRRTSAVGTTLTLSTTVVLADGTGVYAGMTAHGVGTTVVDLATGTVHSRYDLNVRPDAT
jgi:hypothetical protein